MYDSTEEREQINLDIFSPYSLRLLEGRKR
jgi:hypothetical protein